MAEEEKKNSTESEKPAATKAVKKKKEVTRREFNWLALGWTFFAAAAAAGLTATGRFMFPNVVT